MEFSVGTASRPGCALLLLAAACACTQVKAGTVTYIYTDPLGTPLADADANGTVMGTFESRPYGSSYASSGMASAAAGPGYTGHVNDVDTNLVYMQARYYDPSIGRFLSVDPVGPTASELFDFNRYDYVHNNPIVNVDPDGRCTGSHLSNDDGTCLSSGEFTTKAEHPQSYLIKSNTLSFKIFSPVTQGSDGSMSTNGSWALRRPSKKGGIVVQEMKIKVNARREGGERQRVTLHYWEAWLIDAGSKVTNLGTQYDDQFSVGAVDGDGAIQWRASARFYEGKALPSSFVTGAVKQAESLPATYKDPRLSTESSSNAVNRQLDYTWP